MRIAGRCEANTLWAMFGQVDSDGLETVRTARVSSEEESAWA